MKIFCKRKEILKLFKILGINISSHDIVVCLLLSIILFEGIFVYIMWENKNYWENQYFYELHEKYDVEITQV